jgi:CheY-like chemotaxis protein
MAGATVSLAGSASEALERVLAARPDVLVCDIGMPAEDGYSLIRQLRVPEESRESALPAVRLPHMRARRIARKQSVPVFRIISRSPWSLQSCWLS